MISTPFSAWILRIENIRSCLRMVDAPSMPISSDIATNSAGVFFFNSFKCITIFSWELALELGVITKAGGRQDAAIAKEQLTAELRETGRSRAANQVCLTGRGVNWRRCGSARAVSEWPHDHQHNDQRDSDAGDLVDHAQRLAR